MLVAGKQCANQHDLMVAILLGAGGIDAETLKQKGAGRIADVIFRDECGWIFEVKSLESDRPGDSSIQERLGEQLSKDAQFGGPILFGQGRIDIPSLPTPTARNIMRILGQSVADAVRMANKQIKATKNQLDMPLARGCLCVICPPHELDHEVIAWIVADAIRENRNKAVRAVLVAQTPLLAPFGSFSSRSCAIARFSREGIGIPDDLYIRIGKVWAEAHGLPLVEGPPPAGWHGIKNRK